MSEKIKLHILQVGQKFIEEGNSIIQLNQLDICPFLHATNRE